MGIETMERRIAALEGRLLAHRQLLARLLAASPGRAGAEAWLEGRAVLPDGQEDPGAVPAEGLALELALSDELRKLGELARTLAPGPDGD